MLNQRIKLAIAAGAIASEHHQPGHCDPSPSTDPTAVTHGVEASIGDVPWSEVDPVDARDVESVTPHMPGDLDGSRRAHTWETASETLYLVDPVGNRYAITTFPAPSADRGLVGRRQPRPVSGRNIPHPSRRS